LFFIFYLVVAALNPKNQTFYHGLFGLIIHLAFWVCLLGYYKTRNFFELEKFTNLLIVILVAEVVLGSIQYSLPGTHILNRFATGEENNTVVGNAIRVSGTFSYLGGYQAWVTFNGFFIWFLLIRKTPSFVILAVFFLSLYAGLVSGARGAVGLLLITTVFSFIYTGFLFKRFFSLVLSILLFSALTLYWGGGLVNKFKIASENFQARLAWGNDNGELESRIIGSFDEVLHFKGKDPIYGIGLGSTYQGAILLFGESPYLKEYGYNESEAARIVLEGGFILFFFRIILFYVMLRYSYIPTVGKIYLFIIFINSMIVFNTYFSVFFVLGIIFIDRAYYLKTKETQQEEINKQLVTSSAHSSKVLLER
jgi:hypothetical protein